MISFRIESSISNYVCSKNIVLNTVCVLRTPYDVYVDSIYGRVRTAMVNFKYKKLSIEHRIG